MQIIDYDEHTAECPKCEDACTGTSGDARHNLPNFSFDGEKFTCDTCNVRARAYYEVYEDPDEDDRADYMEDITKDIEPEQHAFNEQSVISHPRTPNIYQIQGIL